ncbi:cytochrome P450 4c3 [Caerostris darwini]|uniref:Cytochrome P450 4c3 n=1 Tax=Caerostris darwini TaxID=1538125 RepID=A0AAV4RY52_9ARAC|nr:cytochrome P450 4c3 [Caerostris darwini]
MKYLECVIKESIRLYPVVPLMFRKCTEAFKFMDYTVPAGTSCVIVSQIIHRNPEVYPNPEKFDPERFLPENIRTRHPFAFIPFSAGPRNCIGQKFAMMEIKTVVANILRRFRLVSLDPRDKLNIYPALVTRTVKPLRMRFEPRWT